MGGGKTLVTTPGAILLCRSGVSPHVHTRPSFSLLAAWWAFPAAASAATPLTILWRRWHSLSLTLRAGDDGWLECASSPPLTLPPAQPISPPPSLLGSSPSLFTCLGLPRPFPRLPFPRAFLKRTSGSVIFAGESESRTKSPWSVLMAVLPG